MTTTDRKHFLTNTIIIVKPFRQLNDEYVGVPGNIWLQRLLMKSPEAFSELLIGVLKRGTAVEVPWGAQVHDGSECLTEGGGAKQLGPSVCIWAEVAGVEAWVE